MIRREISIEGMTCNHCVMAVKKELSRIPNVEVKEVTIGKASVVFDEQKVSAERLNAAVAEAGYRVVG
jgi:copper chaperone